MTDDNAAPALRAELGADLGVLDRLTDEEATELHALFRAARRHQLETLTTSIEAALGHLPRLARGPARRIMFG